MTVLFCEKKVGNNSILFTLVKFITMKAMSFFYSRPTMEIEVENKRYLEVDYITEDGKPATLEQKERMWLKYGNGNPEADMPLILDDDCA